MATPQSGSSLRRWLALPVAILICLAVSGLGAIATQAGPGSWYDGLAKAPWNPPAWVFAPVWTALYVSLGFALWLIWKTTVSPGRSRALALFFVQLGL
ncbi:MAG: tryptophan-rich sensory protein, partial [Proteobacteria bacterium]|nr:tryptophan-rich sensory protein [Pseudomonadota bacterium]